MEKFGFQYPSLCFVNNARDTVKRSRRTFVLFLIYVDDAWVFLIFLFLFLFLVVCSNVVNLDGNSSVEKRTGLLKKNPSPLVSTEEFVVHRDKHSCSVGTPLDQTPQQSTLSPPNPFRRKITTISENTWSMSIRTPGSNRDKGSQGVTGVTKCPETIPCTSKTRKRRPFVILD